MALLDRIKYSPESDDAIAWKFPSDNIRLGSQLTVNQSQEAIFFKEGKALDIFGPGRHNLETHNLPILHRLVNLPFGGETPFSAEIWFVNKTIVGGIKWGTARRVPVDEQWRDRVITLHVGAHGTWNMRVADTRNFITQLIGGQSASSIGPERIKKLFGAEIQGQLQVALGKFFKKDNISFFQDAETYLPALAEHIKREISPRFQDFGIEIESFNVKNINIDKKDQKIIAQIDKQNRGISDQEDQIKVRDMERDLELETIERSRDAYVTKRQFDSLEKAAENPGGGAGQLLGAGFGLGAGLSVGVPVGQQIGEAIGTQQQEGSPAESDPQNDPVAKLQQLKQMLADELITEAEFNEKKKQILDAM